MEFWELVFFTALRSYNEVDFNLMFFLHVTIGMEFILGLIIVVLVGAERLFDENFFDGDTELFASIGLWLLAFSVFTVFFAPFAYIIWCALIIAALAAVIYGVRVARGL